MNHRRLDCFAIPIYINHRITEGMAHRIGDTDLPNHESLPRREGCDRYPSADVVVVVVGVSLWLMTGSWVVVSVVVVLVCAKASSLIGRNTHISLSNSVCVYCPFQKGRSPLSPFSQKGRQFPD